MPLSVGILAKNVLKALSPPAEAPIPTIRGDAGDVVRAWDARADFVRRDLPSEFRGLLVCLRSAMGRALVGVDLCSGHLSACRSGIYALLGSQSPGWARARADRGG